MHADRDRQPHGITSRDCGLLAAVDVCPTALHVLIGEVAETTCSQLVSNTAAEVLTTTELMSDTKTTDGLVENLSNSEGASVETAGRKCPEQLQLASVVAATVERNRESGSGVTLANGTEAALSNEDEKTMAVDEQAHISDTSFESATQFPLWHCVAEGEIEIQGTGLFSFSKLRCVTECGLAETLLFIDITVFSPT